MNKKERLIVLITLLCVCSWAVLSWKPSIQPTINKEKERIDYAEAIMPSATELLEQEIDAIYNAMELEQAGLEYSVFEKAYIGYINLREKGQISAKQPILSIADFTRSSQTKRLWILDLGDKKMLLNTWVSHGKGSGGDIPTQFSNELNSHQSSLGFYLTGEVYYGKHGRSLRLDGLDKGFNTRARERAIVLHGADYVSQQAINGLNRLGRSFGCPAVSNDLSDQVIDWVKNKTVLYIHGAEPNYHSVYLNKHQAGRNLLAELFEERKSSDAIDTVDFML